MAIGSGVDKRKNSIRITFTLDGKQQRKTLMLDGGVPMAPTLPNIRHAERLVAEIKEKIRLGLYRQGDYFPDESSDVSRRTVRQQFKHWLTTKRIADTTTSGYNSSSNFWCEAQYEDESKKQLGDLPLEKLLKSHLLYVIKARADIGGKTIANYLGPLKEMLALAFEEEVITRNVSIEVTAPKWFSPDPDPFDVPEIEKVIGHFALKHTGQVHNMVEFWSWTGLRTAEIFGLRWENVDLDTGYIRVKESLIRGKRKDSTKTGVERDVKLNSRSMAALQRQRQHTQIEGEAVFKDPRYDQQWTDERAFRRSFWTPTLKVLGIRYRRPYNMRHTYATAMLMSDMNHSFCAKQLGHSVEMFQRTYTTWIDGPQNAVQMDKLEAALDAAMKATKAKAA
jgi:integrase